MWNFNHPKGWERFHKFTSTKNSLSDCWNDISSVEASYEKRSDRLNSILKDCFSKCKIKKSKQLYDSTIRQLISKRKKFKKQAQADKTNLKLQHKIVKLDHKINKKIAKFNTRLLQKKVNTYGSISNMNYGNLSILLPPNVA